MIRLERRRSLTGAIGGAAALVLGCSGTTQGGPGGSSSAGTIAGTWEVMGTQYSMYPSSLVVTISPTTLTFTGKDSSLTAIAHGDTFGVTYSSGYVRTFNAARTGAPGSAGIVPLPLFGTWSLKNDRNSGCDAVIASDAMSGNCGSVSVWPRFLPSITFGQFTATRTKKLVSSFGDFGGEWSVTTSRQASCTARFENSTLSASCTNALKATGTASLTFDGNEAHGATSAGVEFTAERR